MSKWILGALLVLLAVTVNNWILLGRILDRVPQPGECETCWSKTTEWTGDQAEAVVKFWKAAEQAWPLICEPKP